MTDRRCDWCGWRRHYARGLCKLDYDHQRRHGSPRPAELVVEDGLYWSMVKLPAVQARRRAERMAEISA